MQKPSEILREADASGRGKCTGRPFMIDRKTGKLVSCPLGDLWLATHPLPPAEDINRVGDEAKIYRDLEEMFFVSPESGERKTIIYNERTEDMMGFIWWQNDQAYWTRIQIAELLEANGE